MNHESREHEGSRREYGPDGPFSPPEDDANDRANQERRIAKKEVHPLKFYINCADGSGWNLAAPLDNGSDSIGTPMGETGRRENTWGATGMMDDQSGLSYLKSGTWSNDWDYPKCYTDPQNDNNWEGVKVVGSPTEYYTQQGTGWCNNS